jgi:hypothetical protein
MLWVSSEIARLPNDSTRVKATARTRVQQSLHKLETAVATKSKGTLYWTLISSCLLGTFVHASSPSSIIVKVEEDWELRVGSPDPNSHAPQISLVMSPMASFDSWHVTFEMNHRTEPYYVGGGVHMQLWNGSSLVAHKGWGEFNCLNQAEDLVRWTQVMEVDNGQILTGIKDGNGATWGTFGGSDFRVSSKAPVYTLNEYDVEQSIASGGVSLAGNRVHQVLLRKVRYTKADGSITEETVNRVIR